MTFDPKKYMMNLKGKEYLPVSARLIWFRQDHPDWSIVTTPVEINLEKNFAIFSATIMNTDGKIIATGTKMETVKDFGDFLEKAETGSVGRALAMCGYGTQFAPELSEGARFADSPQGARFAPRPSVPMNGGGNNGGGNFNNRPGATRPPMNGNNGNDREPRPPMPMTAAPEENERPFESAAMPALVAPRDRPQERIAPSPVPPSSPPQMQRPVQAVAPVRVREPEPDYSDPGGSDEPDSPDEDPFDDDEPPVRAAAPLPARPAEPTNLPPVPLGGGDKPNPLGANPMCSAPGCSMRLTPGQVTLSTQKFGKPLCVLHQKDAAGGGAGQGAL